MNNSFSHCCENQFFFILPINNFNCSISRIQVDIFIFDFSQNAFYVDIFEGFYLSIHLFIIDT